MATRKPAKKTKSAATGSLDSRGLLIEAALKIILEHGVDAVRIDAVATEVGVTKGSIYWHFEDRHGLIKAALAEQIRKLSAETVLAVSDALSVSTTKADYLARITPFIIDPFDNAKAKERWARLAVLAETQNDPELKSMMRDVQSRHLEVVVELMTEAQERGFLRADLDPRAVAVALSVINIGSTIIEVLGDNGPKQDDWWALISFFIDALFPPSGGK